VRASQDILLPLNRTIQGLIESSGEVMIEVKMYEMNTTHTTNIGGALPTQFTAFNVNQAATSLVNANQSLVQQAIAQGYISATASNLQIALALIGSGLVQSNLASNLIGVFGGGALQTGISASTNTTFNLGLNSSDTRTLDDVQMRVGDRQAAVVREGTRYPITTSTYTTGISTAASSQSNASINGVSVASLLSQFSGGTSTTIPQVTYEDLGLTLKATPVIQKTGRINMLLDLKIEALAGGSSNGIPVLLSRQFASNLTLADGESALMVSNVSRTESAAMSGIPGLSELPGFQMPTQQDAEKDTSQLVVIVTPHVVRRRSDQLAGPRMAIHIASAH
jgi:Flp pilus assembly secretin CpaC